MFKKILLSLLVIYTISGFFILPLILKPQIVEIANKQINAKLSIDDLYINPFIFKVELSGVRLDSLEGKHLVSFKSLGVDVELYSLFNWALHVKSIKLVKPKISLVYEEDKSFNLASILKPSPSKVEDEKKVEESSEIPRIIVDIISIKKGGIDYEDYTTGNKFDFSLNSLSFKVENIDTNDFESSGGTLRFHTALGETGVIDIRTKITGLKPLKLEGSLDVKETKLYEELEYVKDKLGVEVANGALFMHAEYALNVEDLNATTIDNVSLSLQNLRVKPKDKNYDVLNLKSFAVSGVSIKPFKQDVHVEMISLDTLNVKAKKSKDGVIDWSQWFGKEKEVKDTESVAKIEEEKSDSPVWNVILDTIAISKISADFDDSSVSPNVKTKLNEFNLNIKDVTLAGDKAFTYDMNLLLNDKFKCKSNGDVIHKVLEANSQLTCSDFDVVHYKPYIDQAANKELDIFDISLKSAKVDFDVKATIKDENSKINAIISDANFKLSKLAIDKKSTKENLVKLKSFEIKNVTLDTKKKEVVVKKIAINAFKLNAQKFKDGSINLDGLVKPKESKTKVAKAKTTTKKEKAYRVKLKHFNINKTEVNFNDESIAIATKSKIDKITLNAYNIDSKKNSWLKYNMSLRVNKGGSISSKGDVRHTPLKQKGEFKIDKLSLKEVTPYIQESMFVNLNSGFLSINSKLHYDKNEKNPDLHIEGGIKLESFDVSDSRTNSTLMTFARTELKSFKLDLFPNSLYVDEVDLDAFYVDAQIDKNKMMNFAKLAKVKAEINTTATVEVEDSNTTASEEKAEPFPYKVMKVNMTNGTANFADYSLPIQFKTSMHSLNGNILSISSKADEVTFINIDGKVDEYGATKIKGSINLSNIKSFTDIGVNFRNLSLNSYSGYSAQFAGHKIDKGKLFLDLEYKIQDSNLLGKNSLIIKQIELGDEIDDENITTLPLGFAIALLEDSDGVIDIDMPVEGNLDNPDFKYGALVLKTFVNLIVKAVTSPFNFLGAAMGFDGDDLKFVEFEAAKIVILPPEQEKMDNIAKILVKKPKLSFGIIGAYDIEKDTYGLKTHKLKLDVLERSDDKSKVIMTTEILEDIYTQASSEKVLDTLQEEFEKKYEKEEIYKIEYEKELLKRCANSKVVSVEELKSLATTRAVALKEYLVQTKGIQADRIILEEIQDYPSEDEKWVKVPLKIVVN